MKNISIILILILITSCTGYQYISTTQYVPLNTKKGEIKTHISANNLQAGYALTNYMSVFTDLNYRNFKYPSIWELQGNNNYMSGKFETYDFNLGVSCFKSFNNVVIELLAGAGKGKLNYLNEDLNNSYYQNNFELNAQKINYFVQPNIGYKFYNTGWSAEIALFTRIYKTTYSNIHTTIVKDVDQIIKPYNNYFIGKNNVDLLYIEPGLMMRIGVEKFKLQTIVSPTFKGNDNDVRYKPFNISIGAFIDL